MRAESPARILIIDDMPQNVALMRAQLERVGYEVLAAMSGTEGLELAARQEPDLILLDVMMPGLDGFEVCSRLKSSSVTRSIPVVIITALRDREDRLKALESGAEEFLSRPVDRAELLARVRSLVRLKRLYDEVAVQAELLAVEKNRAEAVLESMSDGVLTTDLQGRITLLNATAEEMAAQAQAWVVGRYWREALSIHDLGGRPLPDDACPVREALRTGQPVTERELLLVRQDGNAIAISLSVSPVRRSGGVAAGAVAVFRDITRQREVDLLKQEFAALVSHELRTPLASIYGFAELLLTREPLSETGRSFAETVFQEAQRMTNLINDFLEVRSLEAGRLTYTVRPVMLHEVVLGLQYQLAPQLAQHRFVLDLPAAPLSVQADEERLLQVLANLISNAVKYSPNGGEIRVSASSEDEHVIVTVRDEGLGLPPAAIPRLFQKFYRVEEDAHRRVTGTGLGLAICRQIVEEMGGRIWAESLGLGQGSTFAFTIPRAEALPAGG